MNGMIVEEMETSSLPVLEEASEALWEAVSGGQPILLTRLGQPAAVVLDYESYQEIEVLASGE